MGFRVCQTTTEARVVDFVPDLLTFHRSELKFYPDPPCNLCCQEYEPDQNQDNERNRSHFAARPVRYGHQHQSNQQPELNISGPFDLWRQIAEHELQRFLELVTLQNKASAY